MSDNDNENQVTNSEETNDQVDENVKFNAMVVAGGLTVCTARCLVQPFDVLKIRLQLQRESFWNRAKEQLGIAPKYLSTRHAIKTIYSEEGIRGFWKGLLAAQFISLMRGVNEFWLASEMTDLFDNTRLRENPMLCDVAANILSGSLITLACTPVDVYKTRVIAKDNISGSIRLVKTWKYIIKNDGYRGLFKGGLAGILQDGIQHSSRVFGFELLNHLSMKFLQVDEMQYLPSTLLFVNGGVAGIFAQFAMYPMELIKRRRQISGFSKYRLGFGADSSCDSIYLCSRTILKSDGIKGLYKGVVAGYLKAFIQVAVTYGMYEKIKGKLEDRNVHK